MVSIKDSRGRSWVVVTGMGLISPCGTGLEKSWENLIAGNSGIRAITRFDTADFDTKFAGEIDDFDPSNWFDRKQQRRNDRFILYAVAAAEMALEDAKYKIPESEAHRVGTIVGAGLGGLETLEKNAAIVTSRGPRKISPFFIPGLIVNLAPGQISIRFGAKGPSWSPISACATSAHAIGESVETIRRGAADVVISGGAESVITPLGIGGFNSMKALSRRNDEPQKASRPWDRDRDGFVMGEGAGILVLESLEHALERGATIRAEVAGYGTTADAYHITALDGVGATRCINMCLQDADVAPSDVQYVNAHGTSTPVGDMKELESIRSVFGDHASSLSVSSSKSMHGHLLGAAGGVEAIVAAKVIETGVIPPTINLDNPEEGTEGLDLVPHTAKSRDVDVAVSNSFGFGGTNATLLLRRYVD